MAKWEPILGEAFADAVFHAVTNIADAIDYPNDLTWKWGLERDAPHSLGFGNAGLAVFFCHVGLALGNRRYVGIGLQYLSDAIDGARHEKMPLDFFRGVSGICWAVRHIENCLNRDLGLGDFLANCETELLRWCQDENPSLELSNGISGTCLYIAEGKAKCSENLLLHAAINLLSTRAESVHPGIAWRVSEKVVSYIRPNRSSGHENVYSTTIGYGVAGIIGALLAIDTMGACGVELKGLITKATSWLVAQRRPKHSHQFPLAVGIDASPFLLPSRGWYLGDPGIFTVLYNTAVAVGYDAWKIAALEIGRAATTIKKKNVPYQMEKPDSRLCDGSAGRAHLYNRMFHASGDELFADEARYWYSRLLESANPLNQTANLSEGGNSQSFLLGSAGIGLALLASVDSIEPTWDRALLASFNAE
jgi:lantibiotic modifying enzyme